MELVNITYAGTGRAYQEYSLKDESLVSSNYISPRFGLEDDYVEMFIFSEEGLTIHQDYQYEGYRPYNSDPNTGYFSSVEIDPVSDAKSVGIDRGIFFVQYNFLRNLFNSSLTQRYWIKDISPSRTELRLDTQDLSDADVLSGFENFQASSDLKNYKNDFYLNFGSNRMLLCTNVAYEEYESGRSHILIKLYAPLPEEFSTKDELWIVEKAAESVEYRIEIEVPFQEISDVQYLRGPNFSIQAIDQVSQTTNFYNYNSLFSSTISSSIQQLKSWMDDKSVRINVDFSDFSNFVHFSSAKERVSNFVYKLGLIEDYTRQIEELYSYQLNQDYTGSISSSVNLIKSNIDRIIEKFDLYEYHLYYSSGSYSWPKRNFSRPYQLYSITSSQASSWLGDETIPGNTIMYSASIHDAENRNRLVNGIPGYLFDDEANAPFVTFLDMIGQHFDNIWLYYKDISNRYVNNNDPDSGISLDMVGHALKSFGMELYTNTNLSENIYYNLFGVNEDGSILPPTGSEMITNYVTSSIDTIPANDVHKEIYKRLYHNLPYLLKTKGTQRGIKALIACYGIPSDILYVKEFGGQNRYLVNGVQDYNPEKVVYYTSSFDINAETLSPYATIQYFDNDKHRNSMDIEVGFSPADIFNAHITSSLGNLSIENIIAQPGYAASSSYDYLDYIKRQYYSDYYVKRFNLWDYIRLVKYYNNSLFKLMRDFVPARANLHTGIIIKSNILERSKYVKYDPTASFENNLSESIDMLEISAGHGGHMTYVTDNTKTYNVLSGSISYTYTDSRERYTGELGGAEIRPKPGPFSQTETSSITNPSSPYGIIGVTYPANLNNVTESRRSRRFFDLDYSYQQLVPVNFERIAEIFDGLITGSVDYKALYDDKNTPMSFVQDYNYYTNAFTVARYYGAKTVSKEYLYYNEGDISYGKKAAIDKIKYQFAYLVDIYTASFNLNNRSNAQVKYIIDNEQNVLDLTKTNTNIFYTQNIFKSGETINISLFDYDPMNPDVQFLTNNSNLRIYEGGWRYSPISYKINGECIWYTLPEPIVDTTRVISAPTIEERIPTQYNLATDFNLRVRENVVTLGNGQTLWTNSWFIVEISNPSAPTPTSNLYFSINYPDKNGNYTKWTTVTILANQRSGEQLANNPNDGTLSFQWNDSTVFIRSVVERYEVDGQDVTISTFVDKIQDCEDLYVVNSREIMLTKILSDPLYYGRVIMSQSVDVPGMEVPVFKFELQTGDMLKFYSPTAGWIEGEEYRVVSLRPSSDASGSFRWIIKTDKPINPEVVSGKQIPGYISKYIINKHVPDETNIILRYNPKSSITQDGVVYPEYIDIEEKDRSGDTIKSLKSQNLI